MNKNTKLFLYTLKMCRSSSWSKHKMLCYQEIVNIIKKDDGTFSSREVCDVFVKAAAFGLARVVGLFLAANETLSNAENFMGDRALERACENGANAVIALLLATGADINHKNYLGKVPLAIAASHHPYQDIVKKLLDAGADPNIADKDGQTPLHQAARCGNSMTIQHLIAAGADVNATNKWANKTPREWALEYGHNNHVIYSFSAKTNNISS